MVECTCLENRKLSNRFESSNLSSSAYSINMPISELIKNRDQVIQILGEFDIEINKIGVKNGDTFVICMGGIYKAIFNQNKDKIIAILKETILEKVPERETC